MKRKTKIILAIFVIIALTMFFATAFYGRYMYRQLYLDSVAYYESGDAAKAYEGFSRLGRGWIGNRSMPGNNKDVGWYLDEMDEDIGCTCTCEYCKQCVHKN